MKKALITVISALAVFALVGCGGGSSDGAGSTNGQIFTANGTFTVSALGVTYSEKLTLTITVSGNTITISDGEDIGSGKLNVDGVSYIVPIFLKPTVENDVSCDAPIRFNGKISGTVVSGTISGSANCTVDGFTARFSFSGSYSGNQTGNAKGPFGSSIAKTLQNSVRHARD